MFRFFPRAAILTIGIALGLATAQAEILELAPSEMRVSAVKALRLGQSSVALKIADALLERDPSDVPALIIKAQAARNLGQYKLAILTGRRSWKISTTDADRYASALVTAQALASSGARTRSQLWLRRATQTAPNEYFRKRAIRDFRYVQSRNPFSTSLRFSVRPSSNINNGSKSDTMIIVGLPFELDGDARALSGVEVSYGFSTSYKKQTAVDRLFRFGFSFDARNYALSEKSKRQAPDQDASDYAFATAKLSFGTTKILGDGRGKVMLDFDVGRSWYAGSSLSNFARITAARSFRKTKSTRSQYKISATRQWRLDDSRRSSTQISFTGHWSKALKAGALLRWHLGVQDTSSESSTSAQKGILAGFSLTPKKGSWVPKQHGHWD